MKNPSQKPDRRLTSDLDLIRTGVWYSHLCKLGQFNSSHAIAMSIEGHVDNKRKWRRYEKGDGIPNQNSLHLAEAIYPGSAEIFMCGPAQTKLWVALHTQDVNELKIIAYASKKVDGVIAHLKLDMHYETEFHIKVRGLATPDNDEFLSICANINDELSTLMPKEYADQIVNDFIEPLADHLYREKNREIYIDFESENRCDVKKEMYLSMMLPTIGNKGSGGGPAGK